MGYVAHLKKLSQKKEFISEGLHIFVLCSFAFAQPLFDILGRQAEFFAIRRSERVDILSLVAGLMIIIPLVFVLVQALIGLFNQRIRKIVHGVMVAFLFVIIVLPPMKHVSGIPGIVLIIAAAFAGIAFALVYIYFNAVKTFVTVLSPALLIFPLLFVFNSPVKKVVFPKEVSATGYPKINSQTPIVMVVFDEMPVTSLMDEHHQIDPIRYPNFAALVKDSFWFKNATTVSAWTHLSIPALLTGNYPSLKKLLPTAEDYPNNLFTILSDSYSLHAIESETHLCPVSICKDTENIGYNDGLTNRLSSLWSDLTIVYPHIILPTDMISTLPDIGTTWKNFGAIKKNPKIYSKDQDQMKKLDPKKAKFLEDRVQIFKKYVDSIEHLNPPGLFFIHLSLPHGPFRYLPSGKEYGNIFEYVPSEKWGDDTQEVITGFQRHLLQLGFVDKLLGDLIMKLKKINIYDPALIILISDHGVSFKPNDERRKISKTNFVDLMFVPLIIKIPYQRQGRIDDRNVETIDILPTMMDILKIDLPFKLDGKSVFEKSDSEKEMKIIFDKDEKLVFGSHLENRFNALEKKIGLFGSGTKENGLFRAGQYGDIVGLRASEMDTSTDFDGTIVIDQARFFQNLDPNSNFVPSMISGQYVSKQKTNKIYNLAISINDVICATTQVRIKNGNVSNFLVIVPETSFHKGKNDFRVFAINNDDGKIKLKHIIDTSAITYVLSDQTITSSSGQIMRIMPGALQGTLDTANITGDVLAFAGWAADIHNFKHPTSILIFENNKFVFSGRTGVLRPDVAKHLNNNALLKSGFSFDLPVSLFKDISNSDIRFFAVSKDGVASELNYYKDYKWRKKK